jgi:endonuclease YncB( thermonuclease family)
MIMRAWPLLASATLLFVLALYASTPSAQKPGAGPPVRVIDGDTLEVDGEIIQLFGIDAPELGQLCESDGSPWPCGVEAALALRKLVTVSDQAPRCSAWGGEQPKSTADGALIEVCQVGDKDLSQVMLQNGYGLATPGSFPDHVEAEKGAKVAHLGIWHSHFVPPWVWRADSEHADKPRGPLRDCNVKGALAADGERVYYVPTDPDYKQLAIDPARGERLFCSDEAARLAGWTRPALKG